MQFSPTKYRRDYGAAVKIKALISVVHRYTHLTMNYRAVGAEEQDVIEAAVPDFRPRLVQSYDHRHATRHRHGFQQLHLQISQERIWSDAGSKFVLITYN